MVKKMNANYKKCCANCNFCKRIETWKYLPNGDVNHTQLPGYACTIFASEGLIVHSVGLDKHNDYCEMFNAKKEIKHE